MRIPSKGRYAVAAIIDLALNVQKGPITIAEIAEKQGISLSYLELLFANLRSKGLISGSRGPGGGYRLAKSPQEISIAQVIEALDENAVYSASAQESYEPFKIWDEVSHRLHQYLSDITIADCIAHKIPAQSLEKEKEAAAI